MNKKHKFGFSTLCAAMVMASTSIISHASVSNLKEISDQELSSVSGQGLLDLSYLSPSDNENPMSSSNIGFYKLGFNADVETNLNARSIQLGCGGDNGAGACDIEINNLSLSGLPDGVDANGAPVFNGERAATSAQLSNPFLQFAIKNPESAALRELTGFRISAEKVNALLTTGTENVASPTDGIKSLSGYLPIAATTANATTAQTTIGKEPNEVIDAKVSITTLFTSDRLAQTMPNDYRTDGLDFSATSAVLNVPGFVVNGNRLSSIDINGVNALIPEIAIDEGPNNALLANLRSENNINQQSCVLVIICNAILELSEGSRIENAHVDVSINQDLDLLHNLKLEDNSFYLGLQSDAMRWPGSKTDDVAQKGWWLSIQNPVDLGQLNVRDEVGLRQAGTQITDLASEYLTDNPIELNLGNANILGLVSDGAVVMNKQIIFDVENYTNPAKGGTPISLNLSNLVLNDQTVTPNCYGNMKFC